MKRTIDILLSIFLLILFSPFLALVAIAVRLSSPGPILYRAVRVGRGGVNFRMLKFRTMFVGADRMGPGITARADPRVTPLGRFLRATKLDELPQLLNVLKGDMALIGPRAESPQFIMYYTPDQLRLLTVSPGMTGPGQIHYTRDQQDQLVDSASAEEFYVKELLAKKLQMDLEYVERPSLLVDLKILAWTAVVVTRGVLHGVSGLGRRAEPLVQDVSRQRGSAGKD